MSKRKPQEETVSTATVAIWRPAGLAEIHAVKAYAGIYRAGVLEVWDEEQLERLIRNRGSSLVVLQPDIFAVSLSSFNHPQNAVYLIPPVAGYIPCDIQAQGTTLKIESPSPYPLPPSVLGAIVLHDRYASMLKAVRA